MYSAEAPAVPEVILKKMTQLVLLLVVNQKHTVKSDEDSFEPFIFTESYSAKIILF